MTVIDEISEIANRWAELGMEVPGTALLGRDKMKRLMQENKSNTIYGNSMSESSTGNTIFQIYTVSGCIDISVSSTVPLNHCSIGRMTLNDIIIEDILLDDEEFTGFNNID